MNAQTLQSRWTHPRDNSEEELASLGPWFHNLHLPDGRRTAPDHPLGDFPAFKWQQLAPHLPADLQGWSALDIGCNAGFYTFELARRGAAVTAVDPDPHYLAQAHWAAVQFGLGERIGLRRASIYDFAASTGQFDLVLFMGVFYHLRHPLLGLDIAARLTRKLMVFQTLRQPGDSVWAGADAELALADTTVMCDPGWPGMGFIENRMAGDPTNWWIPNHAGIGAMLRSTGMHLIRQPADDIYLCAPDPRANRDANLMELRAATGQNWQEIFDQRG